VAASRSAPLTYVFRPEQGRSGRVKGMRGFLARFREDQSGVTSIEYAIIAGMISIAIIAGATTLGGKLNTAFTDVSKQFKGK
jgi:pilus assembly protein Flp/PilA